MHVGARVSVFGGEFGRVGERFDGGALAAQGGLSAVRSHGALADTA